MEWTKKDKKLVIGQRSIHNIVFTTNEMIEDNIVRIVKSCSCLKIRVKGKELHVRFKAGRFPLHLKGVSDSYETTKTISLYTSDGTVDFLTIQAEIYENI